MDHRLLTTALYAVRVRGLGDLEAVIMDLMWRRREPATARDILEQLSPARPLAYTTIMSVMDNLHTKGYLRREMKGRAWLYTPAETKEEHVARLMRQALNTSEDQTAVLAHFVAAMTEAESTALRWLLRRRGSGQP